MTVRPHDLETERGFQDAVIALFRLHGWLVYHVPDSRRATSNGYPDLTMVHPTHGLIFAELKTAKGKTTGDQDGWLADLRAVELAASYAPGPNPIEVYLWRPADLIAGAIEAVLR